MVRIILIKSKVVSYKIIIEYMSFRILRFGMIDVRFSLMKEW